MRRGEVFSYGRGLRSVRRTRSVRTTLPTGGLLVLMNEFAVGVVWDAGAGRPYRCGQAGALVPTLPFASDRSVAAPYAMLLKSGRQGRPLAGWEVAVGYSDALGNPLRG
jgi:hypothetical protein